MFGSKLKKKKERKIKHKIKIDCILPDIQIPANIGWNDLKQMKRSKMIWNFFKVEKRAGGGGYKCITLPVNNLHVEIAIMKKHSIGRRFGSLFWCSHWNIKCSWVAGFAAKNLLLFVIFVGWNGKQMV